MHTGRSSARRVAISRRGENEVMQTRSQAAVRRSTAASGPHRGPVLDIDVEAHVRPGAEQVLQQRDRFRPADPGGGHVAVRELRDPPGGAVTRSSVLSWKATSIPSAVAWTSVSRYA